MTRITCGMLCLTLRLIPSVTKKLWLIATCPLSSPFHDSYYYSVGLHVGLTYIVNCCVLLHVKSQVHIYDDSFCTPPSYREVAIVISVWTHTHFSSVVKVVSISVAEGMLCCVNMKVLYSLINHMESC